MGVGLASGDPRIEPPLLDEDVIVFGFSGVGGAPGTSSPAFRSFVHPPRVGGDH